MSRGQASEKGMLSMGTGGQMVNPLLAYTFESRRHIPLIWILRQEDTHLIWAIRSAGSLSKVIE